MKKRKINDFVDRWKLEDFLGKGGNAFVWTASDSDNKRVALKILKNTYHKSEPYKRFRQEILSHKKMVDDPGVMPLLDYSLPDKPSFKTPAWLAMPIAEQSDRVFYKKYSLYEVVEFIWKISEALIRCAEKDIYHRDIKPANLYVLNGTPLVGDFGLAHVPEREALTKSGRKFGPLFYLPDEMLNEATLANPAPADVFMLAKTLWILASGQTYPPQGQIQTSNTFTCLNIYWNDPKTYMLDEIIERCTNINPLLRPTMKVLSAELSAWLTYDNKLASSIPDLACVAARLNPLIKSHFSTVSQSVTNEQEVNRLQEAIGERLSDMESLIDNQTDLIVELNYDNHINSVATHPDAYNFRSCGPSVNVVAKVGPHDRVTCGFFVSGIGFRSSANMETISLFGAHAIRGVDEKLLWSRQIDIIPNSAYEKQAITEIIEGLYKSLNVALTEYAEHLSK